MRKLVWVALAALVALLFFLLIPPAENSASPAGKNPAAPSSLGIYSSEIADSGNRSVAVLRGFIFADEKNGSLVAFCTESPLQENMLVLAHPSAPGTPQGISEKIASELARCGFSSRMADSEDALSSRNSVIIAPTGAAPEKLAENAALVGERNSRLIVLQSLEGREIDELGKLSAANGSAEFETVRLAPGGGDAAASGAARLAMLPANAAAAQIHAEGNFTFAIALNSSRASCRLVYASESSCRHAGSGELAAPQGRLSGPERLLAGKSGEFEFALPDGRELGRELKFTAVSTLGQDEISRTAVAGGTISEAWASRFALSFPNGGKYVVRIIDQFGRLHAAAYVEVAGLEAAPVRQSGNRHEISLLFGGSPAEGQVDAWIDGGEKKSYSVRNGTLVIWAAPAQGRHTLHLMHQGLETDYEFVQEGGGLAETYLRLGLPALVFLLAVYFLLRAGRKAKYTITFPQFAETPLKIMSATEGDLALAWREADRKLGNHGLPAYPEEMGRELAKIMGWKNGCGVTPYSVGKILQELCARGVFADCTGAFIPMRSMGGFTEGELSVLRALHDCMLERGIPFEKKATIRVRGRELEFALFRGKKSVLAKIGRLRRAVVFESSEAKEAFENSLGIEEEDVRIRLAVSNGKVLFVEASRNEIDRLLP